MIQYNKGLSQTAYQHRAVLYLELTLVQRSLHRRERRIGERRRTRRAQAPATAGAWRSASIASWGREATNRRVWAHDLGAQFGVSGVVDQWAVGVGDDLGGDAAKGFVHRVDLVALGRDVLGGGGEGADLVG